MGCYHLGKFVSKALGKCNGRESGWREERLDYAMAYPPGPPTETYYMRPVARTVTFSGANSVYVIPPAEPPHQQAPEPQPQMPPPPPQQQQQHGPPEHHPVQPQPQQEPPPPAQDTPPAETKPPKRGKNKKSGRVRFGPEPPPPEQQQQQQQQPPQQQQQEQTTQQAPNAGAEHAPARHATPAPPGYFRYTPSPLPRWEAATPRRHEYFSGEYRYSYPTPVREGIYRMATDANRLTTIFSEENPNACAIM